MTLPALLLQLTYGKLAWAIVIAAVIVSLLSSSRQISARAVAQLLGIAIVAMLLPGQFSPAYWLALAFQWPSGLLVGLCLLRLARPWLPEHGDSLPPALAGAITLLGTLLYLDALGLASFGLYYWGFGALGAPLFALAAMALCVAGIVHGYARPQFFAVLGALALFTLLRLPTGNLWDALLDPLLWVWAVTTLAIQAWRTRVRKAQRGKAAERTMETNNINQGVGQW